MARRRLIEIELVGSARTVRNVVFGVLAASCAAAVIGYVLPGHYTEYVSTPHSDFADGGIAPLAILITMTLIVVVLSRLRFGAGIAAGLLAAGVGFGEAIRTVITHLLMRVYWIYGDVIHGLALVGMVVFGLVLFVAELVLYFSARSALERADLQIPAARVVT